MAEPCFHVLPDGRRLAYRLVHGRGPTLVFLPGYMSDMTGSKATALADWAAANGRSCLLLDYSGCGASGGSFAEGTLSRWTEEVLALIDAHVAGEVELVGSSMGGWLMLLVGQALGSRLRGLVGIAVAPDFTDWGYSAEEKARLAAGETILQDNPYGPEPTPTHARFWQDGQQHRLLEGCIPLTCPVRLLHGQEDADVPFATSLRLASGLDSTDVQVTLVKGGDHRLSRPGEIALLLRSVDSLSRTDPAP